MTRGCTVVVDEDIGKGGQEKRVFYVTELDDTIREKPLAGAAFRSTDEWLRLISCVGEGIGVQSGPPGSLRCIV